METTVIQDIDDIAGIPLHDNVFYKFKNCKSLNINVKNVLSIEDCQNCQFTGITQKMPQIAGCYNCTIHMESVFCKDMHIDNCEKCFINLYGGYFEIKKKMYSNFYDSTIVFDHCTVMANDEYDNVHYQNCNMLL